MDNRGREGEKRRKEEQILNYKTRRYRRIPSKLPGNLGRKPYPMFYYYILKTRKLAVI